MPLGLDDPADQTWGPVRWMPTVNSWVGLHAIDEYYPRFKFNNATSTNPTDCPIKHLFNSKFAIDDSITTVLDQTLHFPLSDKIWYFDVLDD